MHEGIWRALDSYYLPWAFLLHLSFFSSSLRAAGFIALAHGEVVTFVPDYLNKCFDNIAHTAIAVGNCLSLLSPPPPCSHDDMSAKTLPKYNLLNMWSFPKEP